MDPQAMAALLPILEGLVALGIPGILLGVAAIPALVIGLICWLNYRHEKQITKVLEAYRADTHQIIEVFSQKHEECVTEFSAKHEKCVSEFSAKHQQVVNFYTNNVQLVKSHEKMAEANQTLIVNNTRVMEHLCVVVESLAKNQGR